jgi:uncharacterized membrane protein
MEIAAWIVAGVLGALYLFAGVTKSTQPYEKLNISMPWTNSFSAPVVKFIGVTEILGALGLVLPKLLDVIDDRSGVEGTLTGLAATGLVLVQLGAIPTHLRRGEAKVLPVNVVLLLAAAFVAAARFGWLS